MKSTKYPGNKYAYGSYQQIINEIPPHKNFITAFAGSCAVSKMKSAAPGFNYAFELSSKTIRLYWNDSKFEIIQTDFIEWVKATTICSKDTFIYCDPPYLFSSRSSGKKYYEHELTETQHVSLLILLKQLDCLICISHYKCKLYDEILTGWRTKSWNVQTHNGPKEECIYMNYPEPKQLHQYDFLGINFTDRQRIKRKKERFGLKFLNMPSQERLACIQFILEYINKV